MAERVNVNVGAFGGLYDDVLVHGMPKGDLTPKHLLMGREYDIRPGGSVVNFARACSQLGLPVTLMGKVGNDMFGRELIIGLARYENLTPRLMVSPEVSTNVGFHFIQDGGEELRSGAGTANQSLTMGDVTYTLGEFLPQASHVYLGGVLKLPNLLPELEKFARAARSLGTKIILDHGRVSNTVSKKDINHVFAILPYVDYYFPSREEFLEVWEVNSIEEGVQKARAVTNATIVIKDEHNGAIGVGKNNELIEVPAFPVQVIDTVGAGDTFNAGFIKAQTLGYNLKDSIIFANAVAALKISQKESPTNEEVYAFLESQGINLCTNRPAKRRRRERTSDGSQMQITS